MGGVLEDQAWYLLMFDLILHSQQGSKLQKSHKIVKNQALIWLPGSFMIIYRIIK